MATSADTGDGVRGLREECQVRRMEHRPGNRRRRTADGEDRHHWTATELLPGVVSSDGDRGDTAWEGRGVGVVLPGYLDQALDLIGISWPNVDEDDYREMAAAMREFAASLDDGTADLHNAVQEMLGANEGPAVDALSGHWDKIKDKHLAGLADVGRAAGTGLDAVAVLIEAAKLAAIVQLGILAAEITAAIAAAPVTLGISTLGGVAGQQACRLAVKRIFKEVERAVVDEIVNTVTAPLQDALGAMVGDLVVQLGSNALGLQDGVDLGKTADAGKGALKLASAGDAGSSGSGGGAGGPGRSA